MQTDTRDAPSVRPEPAGAATEDAGAPSLAPGYYRRPGSARWWRHDELAVVWHDGRWCCVPVVALAALPAEPERPSYDSEAW